MALRPVVSRTVDRALNTAVAGNVPVVRPEVMSFHRRIPVVDLLVGTVLFRSGFLRRRRRGHVDLPRLREGGVDLVGRSVATRFPDLAGTLSAPHLWSLDVPARTLRSPLATTEWLADRIEGWAAASGGRLQIVRSRADLDAVVSPDGAAASPAGRRDRPVGAFIGVQGGHNLEGRPENLAVLHARGVRMMALAHVMDSALAGSGTGRGGGGLSPMGRDVIGEMEQVGMVVDLAHMSSAAIRDAVPLLRRPFVLSHTGFVERCARRGRRRYSAVSRNVSSDDALLIAEAGGVVGVAYATQLFCGDTLAHLIDTIRFAVDLLGADHVALGSDLDGALRAFLDVSRTPLITQGLLDAGMTRHEVAAVMGGNALRVLRSVLA